MNQRCQESVVRIPATDPDREGGDFVALVPILGINPKKPNGNVPGCRRRLEASARPLPLNLRLVDAQQARRLPGQAGWIQPEPFSGTR